MLDCIKGPLRYLADADWHSGRAVVSLKDNWDFTHSEVIKFRSWERKVRVCDAPWHLGV